MLSPHCGIDDSIFTLEYPDSVPALSKAAIAGDLSKIKNLISKGHLPQTPDNRGWTAIHHCVAASQLKSLKFILILKSKSKQHLVNLTTWENVTPLLIALKLPKPSFKMVKTLLKAGANPKYYTFTKLSPLHLACLKRGNLNIVKLLVQYGADVNVQEDLSLFSPLHFAVCESQDLEVVKYLLDLSNLSLDNIYGRTAFLEACNSDFLEAVQLFLKKDRNLANCRSDIPALVYGSLVGNFEMVRLLINSGADPNHRCKAVLPCTNKNSELILLDRKNFLPIHSSLANIQVFRRLLKLTNPQNLLQLETNYYSFALFVIFYGDEELYKTLLRSDLPAKLKTFTSQVLVKYILSYPILDDFMEEKLPILFKYNFSLNPEEIFQDLFSQMHIDKFFSHFLLLSLLAEVGISSSSAFEIKLAVLTVLESFMSTCTDEEQLTDVRSTYDLLLPPVLTLKQICRNVFRQKIRATVKSDWVAVKMIKKYNLPESVKKFLLYETLN